MSGLRGSADLRPQDLVLTMFGAYVRRPGDSVWSGGMVDILKGLGFTYESGRAALARLVVRDLLARQRRGRLVFYTLTERGHALLSGGDRRIFSFGREAPAVAAWTVLWHAIPEDRRVERSRFADRLRFLGFGTVQDATWVAARDRDREVRLLLSELGIEPHVSVLVGRLSRGFPPVALIAQAWNIEGVRQRYQAFAEDFGPLRTAGGRRRLSPEQAFNARTLLLHRFRGFPFVDPELTDPVDPLKADRAEAVKTFDEVYAALEDPASAYFRAVAQCDVASRR